MEIVRKNQFKREFKKALKQGKDIKILKLVIDQLLEEKPLESKYKDHPLRGNYSNSRECHLTPDWLLIYSIKDDCLVLERLGSHSELFH